MKRRWKKIRHRLEWFILKSLTWLLPRLPRSVVVRLAYVIGSAGYYCDRRGRPVALANIEAAFGARYTPRQRVEIARASYRDFARTMLDLFWAPALTAENFHRYIRLENIEVLQQLRARGESAIFLCIHHGNFEWASLAVGFAGFPTTIVTEEFKNPRLNKIFKQCRQVSGHSIIPQKASMIRLLKHVKRGGFSGMLLDLNCRPSEAATVITTFGMAMCATFLHAVLAQRGGARLVPIEGRSQADGTCHVICHEPLELCPGINHQDFTQFCWDYFAPIIRNDPHHWMWAYRHWRFKPPGDACHYPFYAQPSPAFDALLEKIAGAKEIESAPR
jgi:lauroyl/myristoyl acyltransferase